MDAASSKAQRAEGAISLIRLGIVLFNSFLYVSGLTPVGIPALAWTVIIGANIYSIIVVIAKPQFGTPLRAAAWTTVTDAILIVVWLSATGAENSPFVMLWGVSLVAVAFRFGPEATRVATLVYLIADAFLLFAWGQLWPPSGMALARLAYLGFFGALGAVMSSTILEALEREHKMQDLALELEENKAELSAVVASAPSIIVRADREGKILFINQLPEGLTESDVIGKSVLDFVSGGDKETVAAALKDVIATGRRQNYEVESNLPTGKAIFQTHLGPVLKGDTTVGVVVMTTDVTEQVQQREVAQQVVAKEHEMQALEERDEFRSALLNSVAHELNTPLTPLKLQLKILAKRHADEQGFDMLERNIDRLAALVTDLLQVARVESSGLARAWTTHDLEPIVVETAETFRPIAAENRVTIAAETAPKTMVEGDHLRITQILYNLVSNAVKYSPEGGTVRLSAGATEHNVILAVKDDGPGFSPEEMQRLFQPFEQVHATPKGHTGTGLGLYLTKTIVGQHGGEIQVESPGPGKGSTFRVTFPRPQA